jgi:hypothetical protein
MCTVKYQCARALPAVQPVTGDPVTLAYTNWRGETAQRTIVPQRVWFGSTDWHPEPQWLLTALDAEKGAERDFALKDFGNPAVQPDAAAIREAALVKALDAAFPIVRKASVVAKMDAVNASPSDPTALQRKAWMRECYAALELVVSARALIDNTGKDTIATLYGALAQRQQPLGAEFQAAIFSDVESLYDNSPGKEVMPSEARTNRAAHDIGPGDQAVAGAAPWPEGLIHLTNTRRFHVDCATEGCGRRVSTRFDGSDYCEPCGRKVATEGGA